MSADKTNAEKIAQLRKAIPSYRPPSGVSSLPTSASFANAPSQAAQSGNSDEDIFAAEREMLTSISKKSTSSAIASQPPMIAKTSSAASSNNNITNSAANSSNSGNLHQSIVGRLATLEAAQRNLRSELVHREREILTLRNEVEAAKADAKAARNVIALMEEEEAALGEEGGGGTARKGALGRRGDHVAQVDEIKELREENVALKEDNARMRQNAKEFEAFLLDYGLVWVGGNSNSSIDSIGTRSGGNDSSSRSRKGSDAAIDDSANIKIDFAVLILKLRQLSALAGEGKGGVIVSKNGAHQLEKRPSVPITLHKDGFLLYRGPFRAWCEDDSEAFLADVLDGYFPSEFKDSHPEGVIFDVVDFSTKRFSSASSSTSSSSSSSASDKAGTIDQENGFSAFSGQGRSLSSAAHPPRPSSAAAAKMDGRVFSLATVGGTSMPLLDSSSSLHGTAEPMSARSLLSALPERMVTKEGDIVNIKEGVAGVLGIVSTALPSSSAGSAATAVVGKSGIAGGSTSSAAAPAGILVETTVLADMRRMTQEALIGGGGESAPLSPPYEVATVQIRISGKDSSTLIFKMKFDETIGDLRRYLDAHRGGREASYELRSSYPPSAFTDLTKTMKASGLTPNSTIMYRHL